MLHLVDEYIGVETVGTQMGARRRLLRCRLRTRVKIFYLGDRIWEGIAIEVVVASQSFGKGGHLLFSECAFARLHFIEGEWALTDRYLGI